jgi:AcrR family transcriptional regulator
MASSRNAADGNVSDDGVPAGGDGTEPGRQQSAHTSRTVLKATLDLLEDEHTGYRGLTMEAVAARAGVSRATLYQRWPHKAHLVLDAYRTRPLRDITQPPTGDLRADLTAHLRRLAYPLTRVQSGRMIAEITIGAAADPSFGDVYRQTLLRERRGDLLSIFAAARAHGQIREDADVEVAADVALGALHHRLLLSKAPIDAAFVAALTKLILVGLSAGEPYA